MTPEKALMAYKYVMRYGKKWTALQTAQFYVEVARLSRPWDAKADEHGGSM